MCDTEQTRESIMGTLFYADYPGGMFALKLGRNGSSWNALFRLHLERRNPFREYSSIEEVFFVTF